MAAEMDTSGGAASTSELNALPHRRGQSESAHGLNAIRRLAGVAWAAALGETR